MSPANLRGWPYASTFSVPALGMGRVGGSGVGDGSGMGVSTSGSVGAGGGDTSAGTRILVETNAVATGPNTFRCADCYDLPRPYLDRHYSFASQAEHGRRIAEFITNTVDAKTNYLGPRITNFIRTGARNFAVTIDYGAGVAFQRPPSPAGFAILPGGDLFGAPLEVAPGGYTWNDAGGTLVTLSIATTTDDASPALAYPYGSAWEMQDTSRIVRALNRAEDGAWMPLQTYHPSV